MDRNEFEKILKRALELQTSHSDNVYSEEELRSTAKKLQIPDVLIEQAIAETTRGRKQFKVLGSPEEVQEAFIRQFLLSDSAIRTNQGLGSLLTIDKQSIKPGAHPYLSLKVGDPRFPDVEVTISFTQDGQNATLVKWSEIGSIKWSKNIKMLLPSLVLLLITNSMSLGFVIQGQWLISLVVVLMSLFIALLVGAAIFSERKKVEKVLTTYFENLEVFGNLQKQAALEKEVQQLREKQAFIDSFAPQDQNINENNFETEESYIKLRVRQKEKQNN